jgi:RNA polymerase sigma factor (sigma-70 family)
MVREVSAATSHDESAAPRDLLIAHLPVVDRLVNYLCFRRRWSDSETEEFAAHVRLKLVENDFDILRKFKGHSSLAVYLKTVIERMLLDYRTAQWGRWRPSVEAVRSGPNAVLLDRLLTRDGLTFDQAVHVMHTNHAVQMSRDELYAISLRLPQRTRLRLVDADASTAVATYGQPDAELERAEAVAMAARLKPALTRAVKRLTPAERRLLEMRFREGRQVSEIAQTMGVEAPPLYRQFERIVARLRGGMQHFRLPPSLSSSDLDLSISW